MSHRCRRAVFALAMLSFAAGCASGPPEDPWQGFNRPVFRFNEAADHYVVRPAAMTWTFVTFEELRLSVKRFFFNAAFPSRFVSSLGQGEGGMAADEVGRFLVNTTVGLAGLFDPATHFGFPRHDEDVGQMFGRWGLPSGPFLMLPLLGPSNPREIAGMVGDSALSPFRWIPGPVTGTGILKAVNSRALADEEIQQAREIALDFYVFQREAFLKSRAAAIANDEPEAAVEAGGSLDGLYDLPEDE